MDISDNELVRGIKRRSESALEELVKRYGGTIKTVVSYHLEEQLRGECMNDVLLAVWNNIDSFRPEKNSLKNWIGAICKYKCIDYKRKYYREKLTELDENIPSAFSAESALLLRETERETEELLSALPPRDREIFRRRYMENETVRDISEDMKISESALYSRLSRGRRKLRKSLIRSDHNEK